MAKTIVLSDTQQTVLAMLYLTGVREVEIFYGDLIWQAQFKTGKSVVQRLDAAKGKEFSFREFEKAIGRRHFKLQWAIREFCPKYKHILY